VDVCQVVLQDMISIKFALCQYYVHLLWISDIYVFLSD
jgi:hypothetical protein